MPLTKDEFIAGYRLILGREPEKEKIDASTFRHLNFADFRDGLLLSEEFQLSYRQRILKNYKNPAVYADQPCLVFLHIPKTAGTTLHHLLTPLFASNRICPERFNHLHAYSPTELAPFQFYSGHFEYDSLKYIPRRKIKIITMLREPKARLMSLYNFYRAHDPEYVLKNKLPIPTLAHRMSPIDFFRHPRVVRAPGISNSMARAFFGGANFSKWDQTIETPQPRQVAFDRAPEAAMDIILRRLADMDFVGIQEDFERSVTLLFHTLDKAPPTKVDSRMTFEEVSQAGAGATGKFEKQALTPELAEVMIPLTCFDNIVYQRGRLTFEERCAAAGLAPAEDQPSLDGR
jgi:hypothetical protein